ncbi:unnamed protein product [Lactuca saligna]|uniref:Exocyst subunit Exo70 family protein n=1 Tax=Lactuca saligna TaxID=75948 RepID=A0AA35Z7V2_LACSI|nr:unnamed protein product [Lactuca saligna]
MVVRVLYPSERRLCNRVFGYSSATATAADLSFMDVCRVSTMELLNFANGIAMGSRAPERLFKILDVYEAVKDLLSEFETCSSGGRENLVIIKLHSSGGDGEFGDGGSRLEGSVRWCSVVITTTTQVVINYQNRRGKERLRWRSSALAHRQSPSTREVPDETVLVTGWRQQPPPSHLRIFWRKEDHPPPVGESWQSNEEEMGTTIASIGLFVWC